MYKLYDLKSQTMLDKSSREEDIIKTLAEYMKEYINMCFEIEKDEEEYKRICSVADFYHYVNDYNLKQNTERIKQMSCMELKREMLELADKPRIRIKRK